MPDDNQVLIIGQDIFAFNPGKFERMFGYEYKKQVIADKKVAEIEKEYKLSFSRGLGSKCAGQGAQKRPSIKLQKIGDRRGQARAGTGLC